MKTAFKLFLICLLITGCCNYKSDKEQKKTFQSDKTKDTITINGHTYNYDVVSGATKEIKNPGEPLKYEDKLKKMFWSGKPAEGYIEGNYYHTDTVFEGGYTAVIDIVKKDDKLVLVEFDEIAPDYYYSPDWAGIPKRLSGYGFFQAMSSRTDSSLMTLINGLTYLEHQMLTENRLTGEFYCVKGSSNSIRRAFIPAVANLSHTMDVPSGKYYYGLTKKSDIGTLNRLQVIMENNKIIQVKYDEVFEDNPDDILIGELKQFYRQSKYYSIYYPNVMQKDFKAFSDQINKDVIGSQDLLKLSQKTEQDIKFSEELKNYQYLANELISHFRN